MMEHNIHHNVLVDLYGESEYTDDIKLCKHFFCDVKVMELEELITIKGSISSQSESCDLSDSGLASISSH